MKVLFAAFAVFGLAGALNQARAQTPLTLLQFNSNWRYDQSGRELGVAWRTNNYVEDAQWQGPGPGLLGSDDNAIYNSFGGITTPLTISSTITTYYFRTTFTFNQSTNNVTLWATNLVDDGCAIYLNGRLAGGVRMPATFNAATVFGALVTEGQPDVVQLTNFLRFGVNTIAVEVHQSASTSSDVVFGMRLMAFVPQALAITQHPASQTVSVGETASFEVEVSGGPVSYRWQKDGTNLAGATSSTLTIQNAQIGNSGDYRVIVSNSVNSVTSSIARLTVVPDTTGPIVTAAIINNLSFGSNSINVIFNERVNSSTTGTGARNPNNYRVVPVNNTNVSVRITNILYSTALGALLYPDVTDPNWNPNGNYFLVLNNISDDKGIVVPFTNNIAPYTRVGISIPLTVNLTQMSDNWHYYALNFFDPNGPAIYTNTANPWYGLNYNVDLNSGLWGTGPGILYYDPNSTGELCAGDILRTPITFQSPPTLFRRSFNLPNGLGTNGQFRFRYLIDDGLVIYLNGVEIHRYNMPSGPLNENSLAATSISAATCFTNVLIPVSNLRSGSNVLAAAVYQASDTQSDTIFGLEMDGIFLQTPSIPPDPPTNQLRLTMVKQGSTLRFSWPTNFSGYSLVSKSSLSTNIPWVQVPDQTNPYTNTIPSTLTNRFFGIRKL